MAQRRIVYDHRCRMSFRPWPLAWSSTAQHTSSCSHLEAGLRCAEKTDAPVPRSSAECHLCGTDRAVVGQHCRMQHGSRVSLWREEETYSDERGGAGRISRCDPRHHLLIYAADHNRKCASWPPSSRWISGRELTRWLSYAKQKLETDPFSGCLFLFRSRSGTAIKILVYDSQGF